MGKVSRILRITVFGIVLLGLAIMVAIQTMYVQNAAAKKAIQLLQEHFDADISLGEFHFKPFSTILVKDLNVVDRAPYCEQARDTLLHVGTLTARFSLRSLLGPGHDNIIIKSVRLRDAQFNLVIEQGKYNANIARMFHLAPKDTVAPMPEMDILQIKNIEIQNFAFSMQNFSTTPNNFPETAIDWNNLWVHDVNLHAHDFRIKDGLFMGKLDRMSFEERSGWKVKNLSAETRTGKGAVIIDNILLDDGVSTLDLDFKMLGNSKCYPDFVNKVKLVADIRSGRLSMKTLGRFIPPMCFARDDIFALIRGHAEGPVCDIKASDIQLAFENTGFSTTVRGGVKNLPDAENMYIDARLMGTSVQFSSIRPILNGITTHVNVDLDGIAKGETINADIEAKGYINDLNAHAIFKDGGADGSMILDASIHNVMKMGVPPIRVNGTISTNHLNLKTFTGIDILGKTTLNTRFAATIPSGDSPLEAKLDSLNITEATVNGYAYRHIDGNAIMIGDDITADIRFADPSVDADVTIWSDKYSYNGAVTVRRADLNAMNIDKRDSALVQFNLYGRLDKDLSNLQGNANLSNISLTNSDGTFQVESIALNATKDQGIYDILMDSKVAHATFLGNKEHFVADADLFNTTDLLSYVLPGVYLQDNSHIEAQMDTTGFITGELRSGRVAYKNNFIKDICANVSGTLDSLCAEIRSSNIQAAGFIMKDSSIDASLKNNVLDFCYTFDNSTLNDDDQFSRGDINASLTFREDGGFDFDIRPSKLSSVTGMWEIPSSKGSICGKEIIADKVTLRCGKQMIRIDGRTSAEDETVMRAIIKDFDLSPLNRFMKDMNLDIEGTLNGDIALDSPISGKVPGAEMELKFTNLKASGTDLGTMNVRSIFDSDEEVFKISLKESIHRSEVLSAEATYSPESENIDAILTFDRFPIGFAQGFVPDVFSKMEGSLQGAVYLAGPIKNMEISSVGTRLDDGVLAIAFTHVPYKLSGDFEIDNEGIHIGEMTATDRFDQVGKASGGLKWDHFKNMLMDVHLLVRNIEAINIPANEPGVFYGHIFGSGSVSITGPFNELTLAADCTAVGDSQMHIVISDDMDATKSDLLTFTEPAKKDIDPYQKILDKFAVKQDIIHSNFQIRIHATADPRFKAFLDMGGGGFAAGVSGSGNGTVDLALDSDSGNFSIKGDYTLTEGSFDVNASNLVRKVFTIKNGSSIRFPGDVMQSTVNLDAIYQTKASIASLIADTTSISNRRLVECGINIQNKLTNPQVKFSINIPDLEPSVKSSVESALSTDDKVQKQFLSLLLSNNFLPDDQSGIVDNSALLYSNVSEIMANQVNNIFTRLDIPLDLGLNYQPTERGTNVFDVALSTQLFNNRVIVGGSIGNRPGVTSNNDNLVGDLDVEIKLDRPGAFRLKLFSHSADAYTKYLDNSQRNGIGLTWQQEFDNFPAWVKKLFSSKVQKEAIAVREFIESKKTKKMILDE